MTTSTLTLSRGQRALLFAGSCPRVAGTGKCPVEKGAVYRLSKLVELRVLRVTHANTIRDNKVVLTWWLHYEVIDRRDPKRLLRRTPTILAGDFDRMRRERDEYGYPTPVSGEEAAEESSYTTGGKSAIADAGEAVPDDDRQRAIWAKSREAHADFRDAHLDERLGACLDTEQRIAVLQREARRQRIDVRSEARLATRMLEQGRNPSAPIESIERKLRERWAA